MSLTDNGNGYQFPIGKGKKIISWDVESNGLWYQFPIGKGKIEIVVEDNYEAVS